MSSFLTFCLVIQQDLFFYFLLSRESEWKAFPCQLKEIFVCQIFCMKKAPCLLFSDRYHVPGITLPVGPLSVQAAAKLLSALDPRMTSLALLPCSGHSLLWFQTLALSLLCLGWIRVDSKTKHWPLAVLWFPLGSLTPVINVASQIQGEVLQPSSWKGSWYCPRWVHRISNSTVMGKRQCTQCPRLLSIPHLQLPEAPKFRNVTSEVRVTGFTSDF